MVSVLKQLANRLCAAVGWSRVFKTNVEFYIQLNSDPPTLNDVQLIAGQLSDYGSFLEKGYLTIWIKKDRQRLEGREAIDMLAELRDKHGFFLLEGTSKYELPDGSVVPAADVPPGSDVRRVEVRGTVYH